jgi:lipid II:glycine glycyltransferase (peptidoglycan interpeptide bridge formation enzyme)
MERVNADDYYFFNDAYFREILSCKDFDADLKLCIHNKTQRIIGGAIFIKKGTIVQYHLSGRSHECYDVDPTKLLIDTMRIEATEQGFKYFNLGGGRGSSEDSLFRFKSGFSKNVKEFKIWKYIVDQNVYDELVKNHLEKNSNLNLKNISFFPAYRAMTAES